MKALRRMISFVRPYWWIAGLLVITVILPVAMELVVPQALRFVIDQGIEPGDMQAILRGSSLMLGAALLGTIATLGQGLCRAWLSQGLAYDIRNTLFSHIQTFSFANLDRMQTGQLITRLSSDVDLVRMFVSSGLALLLRALLMVGGSTVMMFIIDWQLALIMLALLSMAAILIWGVVRLAKPLFTAIQGKLSVLNTIVQENLAGVQVVKAFVRERYEVDRFETCNDDYMQKNIKAGRLMAVALPLLTILTNLGIVAAVWFGGLGVLGGRLSVGELIAFNNYLLIGMAPLLLLSNILTMVSRADASAERVWEVLDMVPEIKVADLPHKADSLQGRVVFEDVSFQYGGGGNGHQDGPSAPIRAKSRKVLDGINFSIEPGQRVAILGATGSGKSTLVNLIPRFYDVVDGSVRLDGVDARDWELEGLRSKIGHVLQQTTLFSGTVRENIAFGQPDASLDQVVTAAKVAQAHDFIIAMPSGYDSLVEERGANLSGGQKQRIAIARALLIAPKILILDDSTSAVDMETEAEIQGALARRTMGCTTIIIAQRVSSVLSADKIIILEDGRIVAQGRHQDLLESSPIYQEIYHSQLGNGLPGTGNVTR